MSLAIDEAIATKRMLSSIGIPVEGPVQIYCDNKAVVDNSSIPGSSLKKKHTVLAFHKTREAIATGDVMVAHIGGTLNSADINTKVFTRPAHFTQCRAFMDGL